MTINKATLDLMKEFEGLRLKAYPDPGTGGEPITIGYGTTARAGVGIVPKLGMTITKAEADEYFRRTLVKFEAQIRPHIKAPINENEFGAFMSLAYNIGPGAFAKSSALRKFNAGDKAGAANAILLWNKAGGRVMKGLQRRRAAERALFLTPAAPQRPATPPAATTPAKRPTGILWPSLATLVALAAGAVWEWGESIVNAIERLLP
jgi:lysozyme